MCLKIRGSYLGGINANGCLNIGERVEVGERKKDDPLLSPVVL